MLLKCNITNNTMSYTLIILEINKIHLLHIQIKALYNDYHFQAHFS